VARPLASQLALMGRKPSAHVVLWDRRLTSRCNGRARGATLLVPAAERLLVGRTMLVYYAYFYEDDDHDDADGPGLEIDPE
jgi:hypothetical protein